VILSLVPSLVRPIPLKPWMLTNLKIIWQFHAHPVHQKVSRFFGPRYIGDDFLLGPNLVSFNRAVVPLFSTNEDLLNIKRKCDPEVLYPLSYVRYHWNPELVCDKSNVVSLFYLYWYFYIKQARPWMLANLKIIWQFHVHPVHQKVSRFFGPRYIGNDFFFRAE
jgi:hypothetical protein